MAALAGSPTVGLLEVCTRELWLLTDMDRSNDFVDVPIDEKWVETESQKPSAIQTMIQECCWLAN